MNQQPFFSILIATYNRSTYVGECLKSIFDNDFNDFEVVISDDHSQKIEEVKKVIDPYLKHPNVKFIHQPQNLGFHGNYNYLIGEAKGRFSILVDDDDKMTKGALRRLKECIELSPGYDLYGFGYEVIDQNGRFYCSYLPAKTFEISLGKPKFVKNLFFSDVLPFQVFHSCALAFRREIGNEIMRKREASIGADVLFLMEAINSGKKMLVLPEILFSYRKVIGGEEGEYFNWTGPAIINIIARRNILYSILYKDQNLDTYLAELTSSFAYRRRYLYDPIIFNRLMDEETLGKLELKKEHQEELLKFFRPRAYFLHSFRIRTEQAMDHLKLFGPKGLFLMFLNLIQRFNYKLKKR